MPTARAVGRNSLPFPLLASVAEVEAFIAYIMPNDEVGQFLDLARPLSKLTLLPPKPEQERLDLAHYLMVLGIGKKLYLAPAEMERVHKILDIGTGTGICAFPSKNLSCYAWAYRVARGYGNGRFISPCRGKNNLLCSSRKTVLLTTKQVLGNDLSAVQSTWYDNLLMYNVTWNLYAAGCPQTSSSKSMMSKALGFITTPSISSSADTWRVAF